MFPQGIPMQYSSAVGFLYHKQFDNQCYFLPPSPSPFFPSKPRSTPQARANRRKPIRVRPGLASTSARLLHPPAPDLLPPPYTHHPPTKPKGFTMQSIGTCHLTLQSIATCHLTFFSDGISSTDSWLQVAPSLRPRMTAKASVLFNILGCPNTKTANKKMQLCIAKGIDSYHTYNIQSLIQCVCNKHTYELFENCVEPISCQPLQRSHAIN